MKCGFVSLVGRPNVGKSTLLNAILNVPLAITSNKAGTTRNIIQGIYNDEDSQIIFVDTPGIQKPLHKLGNVLNKKAYTATNDVDIILFLVDASCGLVKKDEFIIKRLPNNAIVFLILNKVDKIKKETLFPMIESFQKLYPFKEIIPISALKKDNLKDLVKTIKKYLPEEEKAYFDEDELTNVSLRFLMSEMVREQVLRLTSQEVPHAITCYTETYEELENQVNIGVVIVVDRDNLKKIIIGKGGSMLKAIGQNARIKMENFLSKKVYLETYVKTIDNWRDREKYLLELGLKENEDDV